MLPWAVEHFGEKQAVSWKDYEFDAVILSDEQIPCPHSLTPLERLERLIYLGDDQLRHSENIVSGNTNFSTLKIVITRHYTVK